jgi:hypothetical protein
MRKSRGPSWKVTEGGQQERKAWEVTTDKKGKKTFREMITPSIDATKYQGDHARSRFTLQIYEGCMVGGETASIGDIVICYAINATLLAGRARITAEERQAF